MLNCHLFIIHLAGKTAMRESAGAFNKAASAAYAVLSTEEKDKLQESSVASAQSHPLSVRDVKQRGARMFKNCCVM